MTTNDFLGLIGFCVFAITVAVIWRVVHGAKLAEVRAKEDAQVKDMKRFLDGLHTNCGPIEVAPMEHGVRFTLLWQAFTEWGGKFPFTSRDPLTTEEIRQFKNAYSRISEILSVFEECDFEKDAKGPIHPDQAIIKESQSSERE